MRLIAQSFSGDVKKWIHGLAIGSINTSQRLNKLFLALCQENKNPLHILVEYNTLKRDANETVRDFTIRFNQIYNSIPNNMKPPPDLERQ